MVYYFYRIDIYNQRQTFLGHYFDYRNEYDINYIKDKSIGVMTTNNFNDYYNSIEIKDVSWILYKKTDFIPERDEFRMFSYKGTAKLYHRKVDDFCRIQHLEYDEVWDVKNCNYIDYRQFLSECRDLELTIPKHLIR